MRIKSVKLSLICLSALLLPCISGCSEDSPVTPDGYGSVEITALGDVSLDADTPEYVPMPNAKVFITSEYGVAESQADENGVILLGNLPSSVYSISVKMRHPDNPNILIAGEILNIPVTANQIYTDTLFASQISGTGIAINEIYASGPINDFAYFYDQFIELYNYSGETLYLDGMMLCKFNSNSPVNGAGSDEGNDGDIDGLSYASKFPGNPGEKNHPIEPNTFKTIAVLAINHKENVASSIDLSHADWELYNPYDISDFDNPNIPNVINVLTYRTTEFDLHLNNDCIILATGEDADLQDGLDISTIIDGVQYREDVTMRHTLDVRVDKTTIQVPPRFSGQSMQRREAGYDTNNGKLDWISIASSTPGRQ